MCSICGDTGYVRKMVPLHTWEYRESAATTAPIEAVEVIVMAERFDYCRCVRQPWATTTPSVATVATPAATERQP